MDFSLLPKIELHLHLDCSLSFDVVQQLEPNITYAAYRERFVAPPKCANLADYLTRALSGIRMMQTKEALRLVTLDLFQQLAADQVIYAEIRFAPLEHLEKGLRAVEVVETVLEVLELGCRHANVEAGLILCTLRHYPKAKSLELVQLAEQFKGSAVVGIDIASDESSFSIQNHIAAFEYAQKCGINCTAHAGEARGADSIWETIKNFSVKRIGHGVRSVEDPALLEFLLENNIHLEICPTSNIQTNVFAEMKDHSIQKIYQKGISLSINTDARTISDTTLTKEYQTLRDTFQWGKSDFLKCNLAAIEYAFTAEAIKLRLRHQLKRGFGS